MSKGKKPEMTVVAGGPEKCKCAGCKKTEARYTFCEEHYEWFKFGLVTKEGKQVMDFDKKYGHYQAYLERTNGVRKVA